MDQAERPPEVPSAGSGTGIERDLRRLARSQTRLESLVEKLCEAEIRRKRRRKKARRERPATRPDTWVSTEPVKLPVPPVEIPEVPEVPEESVAFLRKCSLFGPLDRKVLGKVLDRCRVRSLAPKSSLFEAGNIADALHFVKSGVVEILRDEAGAGTSKVVAYIGSGEVVCDIGVFANEKHRSSARVPERAEIVTITRDDFRMLFREEPDLALQVCQTLATRLVGAMVSLRDEKSMSRHLEGRLAYFDLTTVIQSILNTGSTSGVLSVYESDSKPVGHIVVETGEVRRAQCGVLVGEEGFHQLLLQRIDNGSFCFDEKAPDDVRTDLASEDAISIPKMTLLLDAARLADEVQQIQSEHFPNIDKVWFRTAQQLKWEKWESHEIAESIWAAIGQGKSLREIARTIPRCEHVTWQVLLEMKRMNRIACPGQGPAGTNYVAGAPRVPVEVLPTANISIIPADQQLSSNHHGRKLRRPGELG